MGFLPWLRLPRLKGKSRLEQAPMFLPGTRHVPSRYTGRRVRTRAQKRARVAAMVGRRQNVKRLRKARTR